jgi:hypothetical protein
MASGIGALLVFCTEALVEGVYGAPRRSAQIGLIRILRISLLAAALGALKLILSAMPSVCRALDGLGLWAGVILPWRWSRALGE